MKNIENQDEVNSIVGKPSQPVDRVILGKTEAQLVTKWVEQFNKKADGLIKVSKADMVNYLISSHQAKLSDEDIYKIALACYDETRWLSWSLMKLKQAKYNRVQLSFADVIAFKDSLLSIGSNMQKRRKQTQSEQNSVFEVDPDFIKKPQEYVSED
jgi:hypothetical protein